MAAVNDRPWRSVKDAIEIRIRLTPKGGKDALDGLTETADGPAFKARVRAAPEDGAANEALIALLADWLDVAKRNVALVAGQKSRTKMLRVTADPASIEQKLLTAIAPLEKSA